MQKDFLFAGFGGQGVMFAGQTLAYAAMNSGLEVTWIPSYGPEMRGGTAHCFVVISDKPIGSPVSKHPQAVVAFNNPSFTRYEPIVATGGVLAYNSTLITHSSARGDILRLPVPATQMADEIGDLRLANVVMLGAILTAFPAVSLDAIRRVLEDHLPSHRRNLLPLNLQALETGAAHALKFMQTA